MAKEAEVIDKVQAKEVRDSRPLRADARRSRNAVLEAAQAVFAVSGVDAPVREIAERAGVGIATLYRSFPRRSDLVLALLQREMDACADAAPILAAEHEPGEALERWIDRYLDLVATKRGLAKALLSGDPAYETLPSRFTERLEPALRELLAAAAAVGKVRADVSSEEIFLAVGSICAFAHHQGPDYASRMIALLFDGLRYGANAR